MQSYLAHWNEGDAPFETSHRNLGKPKITLLRSAAEAEKVNYLLPLPFQDFLNNLSIKPAQEVASRKGRNSKCEQKGKKKKFPKAKGKPQGLTKLNEPLIKTKCRSWEQLKE